MRIKKRKQKKKEQKPSKVLIQKETYNEVGNFCF